MSYHHCKLIASGVARLHGDLLLVQQSYPGDPLTSWGLPGGQVEPGEELLAGLQRSILGGIVCCLSSKKTNRQ